MHKIKLTILPEMDWWSNTHLFCTLYFLGGWQVYFLLQLYPDPVKATSGQLAPCRGHGFVGILCNELGLHRQLASSDIILIWVQRESQRAITWSVDSIRPFNTPILSPPATHCYHLWYYYEPAQKSCQKQSIIWVSETCTPTQWLLIDGWIIGANFICTGLGTGKLPHNNCLKSP